MQILTITSQGQITIPKSLRREYNIEGSTKVAVEKRKDGILIVPKKDFWSLGGSLKGPIKATDEDLRKAREEFAKRWPRKMP